MIMEILKVGKNPVKQCQEFSMLYGKVKEYRAFSRACMLRSWRLFWARHCFWWSRRRSLQLLGFLYLQLGGIYRWQGVDRKVLDHYIIGNLHKFICKYVSFYWGFIGTDVRHIWVSVSQVETSNFFLHFFEKGCLCNSVKLDSNNG